MGVTNYHTINGRIVGQTKDGVRTHYAPDALGSVVATLDANGTVENTYRYKPYGSLLAKTGTAEDPRFMWVGSRGYSSSAAHDLHFVRRRYYFALSALWTSVDPLFRLQEPYTYVRGNPTTLIDPSGLQPCCCCSITWAKHFCSVSRNHPTFVGHVIETFVRMTSRQRTTADRGGGTCTLRWYEKTDRDYYYGGPPIGVIAPPLDQYFEVGDYPPLDNPGAGFSPPSKCDTSTQFIDFDPAGAHNIGSKAEFTRRLCIRVEITDGCTGRTTVLKFLQYISFGPGGVPLVVSPRDPLPGGVDLIQYCSRDKG